MRPIFLVLALLVAAPTVNAAGSCPSCVLGLWDDAAMTQNFGTITPLVPKTLYLGIQLSGGLPGVIAIEFSLAGLEPTDNILLDARCITNPPYWGGSGGSWWAPADTTQTGGVTIIWTTCRSGSQALFQLTLVCLNPEVPVNRVLRVTHRYPPTNPTYGLTNPIVLDCSAPKLRSPTFTAFRVTGGTYVLNPVVPADGRAWGAVKGLYR